VVLALAALTVVTSVVDAIAGGSLAPVVMPSLPITLLLPAGLALAARQAWRKATGRTAPPSGVDHQAWRSRWSSAEPSDLAAGSEK
jgi:hypothetical protein